MKTLRYVTSACPLTPFTTYALPHKKLIWIFWRIGLSDAKFYIAATDVIHSIAPDPMAGAFLNKLEKIQGMS